MAAGVVADRPTDWAEAGVAAAAAVCVGEGRAAALCVGAGVRVDDGGGSRVRGASREETSKAALWFARTAASRSTLRQERADEGKEKAAVSDMAKAQSTGLVMAVACMA